MVLQQSNVQLGWEAVLSTGQVNTFPSFVSSLAKMPVPIRGRYGSQRDRMVSGASSYQSADALILSPPETSTQKATAPFGRRQG